MILDLTASRLCYSILTMLEQINPEEFNQNTTYGDIIELALLNFYNGFIGAKKDEITLIDNPSRLPNVKNPTKFVDDLTQPNKQRQKIGNGGLYWIKTDSLKIAPLVAGSETGIIYHQSWIINIIFYSIAI